ncbi:MULTISPECIES: flagellar hook protein FlgE [Rhizobium]|uniref:Flagellar hook protein FlgE n=1 Tax=Rhizobium tropici TaxID=398 RepID=A0A329Y2D5_RHITR|nr:MULTISPECIES: flagellar hook protein FlgE [Rhizobium]MBB3285074.1 flagellar hook protein FlgE [Rhizobium sp. BK252]MBB3399813.1 flagellar hook protein FlgE [Rhizobium sp. BK289]MBB3412393.1 flagellar hook protein FlgE [Rhizobium sp. BK284]MBB3480279.1 flagellar hook protein FlgE [Rhizobium sp. BK347]MDK4718953.1 flagellar hook protein FlgE [Rhizobium sp. CNPSo 3968]
MSIFGSMKTSVSGMNAQANKLSTVSDNIANVNTTAYKSATASFSSLILPSGGGNYNSGSVETNVSYSVSQQGDAISTSSGTDLSIRGAGFFVVQGADGSTVLTRAGDFKPDANGNLVNSAGYTLMGYSYASGAPAVVVNGFDGLVPINVNQNGLANSPSTSGSFTGNLNSGATVVTASATVALPSTGYTGTGGTGSTPPVTTNTQKSSVVAYDKLGNTVMYDIYYTKTADAKPADPTTTPPTPATSGTWEVAVYRNADAATGTGSSFPYSSGPVATSTLTFDTSGNMTSGGTFTITDPKTAGSIAMDLSKMTQKAAAFASTGSTNGQAAAAVTGVTIDKNGVVYANYAKGDPKAIYQIPLATVASPDKLTLMSGNVYQANAESGVTVTSFANSNGLGYIQSNSLEASNVDLAGQLTDMIQAQKSYTANSKVFQTGSDLLDVLVNLQR